MNKLVVWIVKKTDFKVKVVKCKLPHTTSHCISYVVQLRFGKLVNPTAYAGQVCDFNQKPPPAPGSSCIDNRSIRQKWDRIKQWSSCRTNTLHVSHLIYIYKKINKKEIQFHDSDHISSLYNKSHTIRSLRKNSMLDWHWFRSSISSILQLNFLRQKKKKKIRGS